MHKKIYYFTILLFLIFTHEIYSEQPEASSDVRAKIAEKLKLKPYKNNAFFSISNSGLLRINNNGDLMYIKPNDLFYPEDNIMLMARYVFPLNKSLGIGPSIFNENVFKIVHFEDSPYEKSVSLLFNSIILPGLAFNIMPFHKKLQMPLFVLSIDFGPGIELNNNIEDGDLLKSKFGGYSCQSLILPVMPIHLFISYINIVAVMATQVNESWYPGVAWRGILNMKFIFFNFINKKANSGLRVKYRGNFTLTGKPDINDLTSQYAYSKLEATLFTGAVKGLEIHFGYAFEYITFARDNCYHIGNKILSEFSWNKYNFHIFFRYLLIFWDNGMPYGFPVNEFEVGLRYTLNFM